MTAGDSVDAVSGGIVQVDDSSASLGLDLEAAVRAGARGLWLTGPQRLAADGPRATVALVRLLREAEALGLPVSWHGQLGDGIETALVVHLAPPDPVAGDPRAADVEDWRSRHRPALCYFRVGPDFVFVKDVRRSDASARFRLDGVVSEFLALEAVVDVPSLEPSTRAVLDDLHEQDLVIRLGDVATLLPNRLRRWPVPALEI